jgi:hypothetical protein
MAFFWRESKLLPIETSIMLASIAFRWPRVKAILDGIMKRWIMR